MKHAVCLMLMLLWMSMACTKEDKSQLQDPVSTESNTDSLDSVIQGKKPEPQWENYSIAKGEHYNGYLNLNPFPSDSLAFRFAFDSTAIYQTEILNNQKDWNKLMGFSDCGSLHHTNSVRLVWRYNPEAGIEIGEYFYRNEVRSYEQLATVQIGDTVSAIIAARPESYLLKVNEVQDVQSRPCNNKENRYQLFPYFGGDEVAPHDINVFIQQLYPAK